MAGHLHTSPRLHLAANTLHAGTARPMAEHSLIQKANESPSVQVTPSCLPPTCLKPAQHAMSRMKGGKKMTLAVSVMGLMLNH
jgi:hypothetical protein